MLFHSSIRKELSRTFGATLVVLVTIVMTMMLIRTLGLASKGSVNPSEVFLVMTYTVLGYMPTILSLCLFIAIVGTLSRMYRDSEMVIWFSSGRGLVDFLRPLFGFAWPILLLVALFALVGWPWANSQTDGMRQRYESRSDIERVAPGEFRESAGRLRVFFIDKDAPDSSTANNIFISSIERNLHIITSARRGHMEDIDGKRFLLLSNGQRLERPLTPTDGIKISEFETYGAQVGGSASDSSDATPVRTRTTLTLLRDPTADNQGELAWRIGMLFGAANFVILALALSSVNPRVGRSGNYLFALFAFILYYNMLNLGQNWVEFRQIHDGWIHARAPWRRAGVQPALARKTTFQLGLHGTPQPTRNDTQRVNTIRRLIYVEVVKSVGFVALGFLSLFFFFDFVDELQSIGRPETLGYSAAQALAYVAMLIPSHLYELLPIAVLIGTIFVMARLAQSSEFTILRTSGLGPWRALRTLLLLGLGFVILTFAVGDYVAPFTDRTAQLLKARFQNAYSLVGNTGAWLKERQGDTSFAVNVSTMERNGTLKDPRIFEFDERGSSRRK